MKNLAFSITAQPREPVETLHLTPRPCPSHPNLSIFELESLAQQISSVDGISLPQARQQIARFRGAPSGPGILAMRRQIRRLSLLRALTPHRHVNVLD